MSSGANLEVELAARGDVPRARSVDEKALKQLTQLDSDQDEVLVGPNGEQYPSKEDLATLRRTYGSVNWVIYTIGLLELVERELGLYIPGSATHMSQVSLTMEQLSSVSSARRTLLFITDISSHQLLVLPSSGRLHHWCRRDRQAGWSTWPWSANFNSPDPVQSVLGVPHASCW